ncbi:MAG: hypothetical protein PHO32_08415, partial [Candidatus Cloacimonetes bacterium]|nr:hypothetical protein [Candidatus Cloacimonadota bacterium]
MVEDALITELDKQSSVSVTRIIECAFQQNRSKDTNHGTWVADSYESLNNYISKYWRPHKAKQMESLSIMLAKKELYFSGEVDLIDWGCGQGLATLCFLEFVKAKGLTIKVKSLTLIDASELAVKRAKYFCERFGVDASPMIIKSDLNLLVPSIIPHGKTGKTFHFLSNILDMMEIDYHKVFSNLTSSQFNANLVFCISTVVPRDPTRNARLCEFVKLFKIEFPDTYEEHTRRICKRENETCRNCPEYSKLCNWSFKNRYWTRNEVVFEIKLPENVQTKIIDFPPIPIPVMESQVYRTYIGHFQAAYAFDPIIEQDAYLKLKGYIHSNSFFTISSDSIVETKYSKNRSCYSVLANQIMRGVPTYLPIDLATQMSKKQDAMVELDPLYGKIMYGFTEKWKADFISL